MSVTIITITSSTTTNATINDIVRPDASSPKQTTERLCNLLHGFGAGDIKPASFDVSVSGSAATAYLNATGLPTAAQTFVLNGVTFTARASGAGADEFNIGATAQATIANIVAAVNASVTAGVTGVITAAQNDRYAVFTAVTVGTAGNSLTLVESLSNVTRSGATFTGGTATVVTSYTVG